MPPDRSEPTEAELALCRVENLVWDKLAADGEHGEEQLEVRLNLSLFSVMLAVDPDGTLFKRPYKIQPKVLEAEILRDELRAFEAQKPLVDEVIRLTSKLIAQWETKSSDSYITEQELMLANRKLAEFKHG